MRRTSMFTFTFSWAKLCTCIQKSFTTANTKLFKNGKPQAVLMTTELAYSTWYVDLVIERLGQKPRSRPAQRRMGEALNKLIASHAVALGVTLVPNNEAVFVNYAGLRVENWVSYR